MAHIDFSLRCHVWTQKLEEGGDWEQTRQQQNERETREDRNSGGRWEKKKGGGRHERKIKSRGGCWVGSEGMTRKRAQHERPSKIVRNHAPVHLGEKKLLYIEMTLICWTVCWWWGGVGLKAVLIYSCPDPTIPLRTRALWNRTSGPPFIEGGGLM